MVTAILDELGRAGIDQLPAALAADAGYWNEQHMDEVVANKHIPVLVAPDHAAPPARMDGRTVRVDANRARLRARTGAIQETQTNNRTNVR
jgi:hypothetical protein